MTFIRKTDSRSLLKPQGEVRDRLGHWGEKYILECRTDWSLYRLVTIPARLVTIQDIQRHFLYLWSTCPFKHENGTINID